MGKTNKYTKKKYSYSKTLLGGGFLDMLRKNKKSDGKLNKMSTKEKVELIILALGGMDQVVKRANANKEKLEERIKNEVKNIAVEADPPDVPPPPPVKNDPLPPQVQPPPPPPPLPISQASGLEPEIRTPRGGKKRTRRRSRNFR